MNLKTMRKKSGKTQKQIADEIGVSSNTYSVWETGRVQLPNYARKKLSEIFRIPEDEIEINGYEQEPKDVQNTILRKKQDELATYITHFGVSACNEISASIANLFMTLEQLPEPAENPDPYFEKYNQRSVLYKVSRIINMIAGSIDTYVVASTMFDKTNFEAINGVYAHLLESIRALREYMTDYLFNVTKEAIASAQDPEVYTEYLQAFSKHNDVVYKDDPLHEAIKKYYAE